MATEDKHIQDDEKRNILQEKKLTNLNEGFSGENIPKDYDPSKECVDDRFRYENETDTNENRIDED